MLQEIKGRFYESLGGSYFRRLLAPIDKSLDLITSYKLVLYFLCLLAGWAIILSAFGVLPYDWYQVVFSIALLGSVCWISSWLFAKYLNIPRNSESDFISALILVLILSPAGTLSEYGILAVAGFIAMASKYVLVIIRRHVFNPAAIGAFSAGLLFDYFPSWWVGTASLMPLVLLGGLLILRKLKRFAMAGTFLAVYIAVFSFNVLSGGSLADVADGLRLSLVSTALLFFAFIMLIEPLTSPSNLKKGILYAALVGTLYSVSDFKLAPEEALLLGNAFAYLLMRDKRLRLEFVKKRKEAEGIYSYIFSGRDGLRYSAGQYLEWTLPVNQSDSRGNRRYFTVSSSPTEDRLMLSMRLPETPSTFKRYLHGLSPGGKLLVSHLSGDFTLPSDKSKKLAFVAGGIGVTPFRSITKYLLDTSESRDIILLYSANDEAELAFRELFDKAKAVGVKTAYTLTGEKNRGWKGLTGPVDTALIKRAVPDFAQRQFYVSGPYGFVQAVRDELEKLNVPAGNIKLDYFPGYS